MKTARPDTMDVGFLVWQLGGDKHLMLPILCDAVTLLADGFTTDHNQFIALNDVLYFLAGDETNGAELFAYDPAVGVYLAANFNPGPADSGPSYFATVDNKLFMGAYTPAYGNELMVSTDVSCGLTLLQRVH